MQNLAVYKRRLGGARRAAALLGIAAGLLAVGAAGAESLRVRDYTPTTLAAIRPPAGAAADGRIELLRQDARYLTKVHTDGVSRSVGAAARAAVEQWIQARRMKPDIVAIFGTEFAFRESGREYWIPVFALGNGITTAAANTPVTLLLHHAGRIGAEPFLVAMVVAPGWELRDKALEMDARRERHASVRALVETVRRCAAEWREAHPGQGYPPSLAEIGPRGDGCLAAAVVDGSPFNYRVRYLAGPLDAARERRLYSICAQPTDYSTAPAATFIGDEEGTFPPMAESSGDRPVDCWQAWGPSGYQIAARLVKQCLIEYAAANPAVGYPRDLAALAAQTPRCLPPDFRLDPAGAIEAPFDRIRYAPKPTAGGGAARGFQLWLQSKSMPANFLYLDEGGILRAALGRDARPGDPTLEEENALYNRDRERARADLDRFRTGCEGGRMSDCVEAGFRYFLLNQGPSLQLWDKACAGGVKEACLLSKSRPFQFEIFEWTFALRRLCFRGDADACRRLDEYVARTELKSNP